MVGDVLRRDMQVAGKLSGEGILSAVLFDGRRANGKQPPFLAQLPCGCADFGMQCGSANVVRRMRANDEE